VDTNRISIINQDQSESLAAAEGATLGFTVIKAEKGSTEAVYIAPGDFAAIYEHFGYTSAEYPQLQELLDFNASHGVYVSAPYDASASNKVPIAYVTPAGILSRHAPVTVTGARLESIELDDASILNINSFDADQEVLVPLGRELSYFGDGADVAAPITYESGDTKVLSFNLGFDISPTLSGELVSPATSLMHFLNPSAFDAADPARVLRNASTADAVISVDIPGASALIDLYLEVDGTNLRIRDNAGHDIGLLSSNGGILSIDIDSSFTRGALTGLYATYFSANAIATTWASDSFRSTVKVYWKATLNRDAIYAAVYQRYLSERETTITFPKQQLGNTISFTVSEQITPTSYGSRTVTGSLVDEALDGFGAPLSFKERLASNPFVNVAVVKQFDGDSTFTSTRTASGPNFTLSPVVLRRGVRVVNDSSLELGWTEAASPDYDAVEIFFNPMPLTSAVTLFTSLVNSHSLSRFVGSKTVTPEQAVDGLPELTYGKNYYIATNLFIRRSGFTREDFTAPLVGAYAGMIAKCLDAKYGGVAPMFLNSGGVGGQLEGITVKKPVYKYTKDQLTILDEANYNPIVRDAAHGIMLTSQKTAKGGTLSDWSYIGHSSAFLKIQREIRDQVMAPQIGKPNNPYYRELRAQQVLSLLRPRVEGLSRIWASGTVDTSSVNTADVLAQRKFKLAVTVRVDIFSEGVELVFTNLGQTTETV
jgi:hypothetical protein